MQVKKTKNKTDLVSYIFVTECLTEQWADDAV